MPGQRIKWDSPASETVTGAPADVREFFYKAYSNAAPFFSDESFGFAEGLTADAACAAAVSNYGHPCGLFSLEVYQSADAYHKGEPALTRWLSERATEAIGHTRGGATMSEWVFDKERRVWQLDVGDGRREDVEAGSALERELQRQADLRRAIAQMGSALAEVYTPALTRLTEALGMMADAVHKMRTRKEAQP
jgi:hypothetical protein